MHAEMLAPIQQPAVERLCQLAEVETRVLLGALEAGGAAIGYELHEDRFNAVRSRIANHKDGISVLLYRQDVRTALLEDADVVTLYLLPVSNGELKAKLLTECRPGCKIISHDFAMPDWEPETVEQVQCEDRIHTVYRWIIPDAGTNG